MRTFIRQVKTAKGTTRFYLAAVDDDGVEHGHGGYPTRKAAKAAAAVLDTAGAEGRYTRPDRTTVGSYLTDEWLPARANADLSPNTRQTDANMVRAWVVPHIGRIPLQKLAPRDLDKLYAALRDHGGHGGTPLRGKSVRNCHVMLHKALGDAVRRGYLARNPAAAVDPPAKDDSVVRTAWTAAEARQFLAVAAHDRLAAVWRLVLSAGLRRGELAGLTWDDIDLDSGAVRVQRQVLVGPGGPYVRGTTKSRRVRTVWIDPATTAALRAWHVAQGTERLAFGPAWHADGGVGQVAPWVVTEADGTVVHPTTLGKRWAALVAKAGATPLTLHGARHTSATLALEAGVRLDIVSQQLGHASVAITADVYGHITPAAAGDAAARLGAVLDG